MRTVPLLAMLLVLACGPVVASDEPELRLDWEVVSRRPHDGAAYTQGLLLDDHGRLFESTGQWGRSTLREVDPASGRLLRSRSLSDALFGEGLELVGDELVQLTWRAGIALQWDVESFDLVGSHSYEGEGWGLCYDGDRLVMSDGSSSLTFRDAATFEPTGSVEVTLEGQPLDELNELECVDGSVWANVWMRDLIVRIDPQDGRVTGVLDMHGLLEPHPAETVRGAVLNGIAWDETSGTFLVTGKYWPQMFEIRVTDPST